MSVQVRFQPSGDSVAADEGAVLLDCIRRAGLPLASACGAGALCGRCGVQVLAGAGSLSAETGNETNAKARNRIDPAQRLACQAQVLDDVEITTTYW